MRCWSSFGGPRHLPSFGVSVISMRFGHWHYASLSHYPWLSHYCLCFKHKLPLDGKTSLHSYLAGAFSFIGSQIFTYMATALS